MHAFFKFLEIVCHTGTKYSYYPLNEEVNTKVKATVNCRI